MSADLAAELAACRAELAACKRERNTLGIIVGSIEQIVAAQWRQQRACPFCQGISYHREMCYLFPGMGRLILAEYETIEQHRDRLLAERGDRPARSTLRSRMKR